MHNLVLEDGVCQNQGRLVILQRCSYTNDELRNAADLQTLGISSHLKIYTK